jgi:hypothetical protein
MSEREMFEKSFKRPSNYFSFQDQWDIDKYLGILDWRAVVTLRKKIKKDLINTIRDKR